MDQCLPLLPSCLSFDLPPPQVPLPSPPLTHSGPKALRSLNFSNSNTFATRMIMRLEKLYGHWASPAGPRICKRERKNIGTGCLWFKHKLSAYVPVSVSLSCGFTRVSLLLVASVYSWKNSHKFTAVNIALIFLLLHFLQFNGECFGI